jgi:DNA-binding GntR family transcriptional regulator
MAFWHEACSQINDEDKAELRRYVDSARAKLHDTRVRIPFEEHRAFHLTIFKHLDNPFVIGLLEAYWDAYEAVELNRYAEYGYHTQVWDYHERILNAICAGDYNAAQEAFMQHTRLLHHQPGCRTWNTGRKHLSQKSPNRPKGAARRPSAKRKDLWF